MTIANQKVKINKRFIKFLLLVIVVLMCLFP